MSTPENRPAACSGCGKAIRQDIDSRWYATAGPWIPPPGQSTYAALDLEVNPVPWRCAAHRTTGEHYPETEHEGTRPDIRDQEEPRERPRLKAPFTPIVRASSIIEANVVLPDAVFDELAAALDAPPRNTRLRELLRVASLEEPGEEAGDEHG